MQFGGEQVGAVGQARDQTDDGFRCRIVCGKFVAIARSRLYSGDDGVEFRQDIAKRRGQRRHHLGRNGARAGDDDIQDEAGLGRRGLVRCAGVQGRLPLRPDQCAAYFAQFGDREKFGTFVQVGRAFGRYIFVP